MWGTICSILLVIGRILLILLIILLILLLLLLFVPFRYTASGNGSTETGVYYGEACVTWLLHLVSVTLSFSKGDSAVPDGKHLSIKVLGFDPKAAKKKRADEKKAKAKAAKKEKLEEIKQEDPERYEELKSAAADRKAEKEAAKKRHEEEAAKRREEEKRKREEEAAERARAEKRTERLKIYAMQRMGVLRRAARAGAETVQKFLAYLIYGIIQIALIPAYLSDLLASAVRRITSILETIGEWGDFITDPRTQGAIEHLLKYVKKLLKHILPNRADGNITYGFDDPGTTGTVLAAASGLYPLYGGSVRINPVFDGQVFDGVLTMKGYVRLGYVLYAVLAAVLNRNIWFVYKTYKGLREA